MSARKHNRPTAKLKVIPPHPDYEDEITRDQVEAIRRLADPTGERAKRRVVLYPAVA